MNSLEAEYSFLAPTWRLPPVATPSMYSRTYGSSSYLPTTSELNPDWTLWSNTMYNSRYRPPYVPSTTLRRNYPISTNYQQSVPFNYHLEQHNYQLSHGQTTQSGPASYQQARNPYGANVNPDQDPNLTMNVHPRNDYDSHNNHNQKNTNNHNQNHSQYGQSQHQTMNRSLTYATNPPSPPPSQKRRVQIVDHNRQTPSTVGNGYVSGRSSHSSNHTNTHSQKNQTPDANRSHQKARAPVSNQYRGHGEEHRSNHHASTGNIHDYLYGPPPQDTGGYSTAYKNQQRRLQEEKLSRKSVMSDYKAYAQNGGFGPTFGNAESHKYEEKVDTDRKKKSYSKTVRAKNQYKIEEQKRIRSQQSQEKNRSGPIPKQQRSDTTRSHFSSTPEAKEYADKIERPHHLKPVVRLRDPTSGNVIIRDAYDQHRHRLSS